MVYVNLSLWDIMAFDEGKEIVKSGDRDLLLGYLYSLGMDVEKGLDEEVVLHRPLSKKDKEPWLGLRFTAIERSDKEYLSGPLASWDAKREAIRDPSMRSELLNMGREGSSDKVFTNEDTARNYIRNEKNKEF